jgi:RNA exonuclease 4
MLDKSCLPVVGEDFKVVQQRVADLLKDRILVGHALHNDMKVCKLMHMYVSKITVRCYSNS